MKFTCEKYLLSLAVATAGRAAAAKSPIPALEGLLVEAGATAPWKLAVRRKMMRAHSGGGARRKATLGRRGRR